MQTLIVTLLALLLTAGAIFLYRHFYLNPQGETFKKPFLILLGILLGLYVILFLCLQINLSLIINHNKTVFTKRLHAMEEQKQREIDMLKKNYAKELALVEWKNKVFTSNSEMEKSLNKEKTDYELSPEEVRMWRNLAENNTIEKLIPKDNSKDILKEYQARLKKSLTDVRDGHTLMNSDIRLLADNINAIRLIGKEYEKVLSGFRELYENIVANNQNGTIMQPPKQKKFLFFPVKQKEYEQLLKQYYESQGNQKASTEIAAKLKLTIEKAEQEFRSINRKFDSNLAFLENTSNGISYNTDKLENLIEAAISEAEIVSETDTKTTNQIKVINNNKTN